MIDDALRRVIGEHLGRAVALATSPVRMSGGFWAAIYGFELAGATGAWRGPLVLRVMPDAVVARREIAVQRALAEQGFPTPAVLLDGDDAEIGGAFMVMPRVSGSPPIGGLDLGPAGMGRIPGAVRRLPALLAGITAELHALDVAPLATALASTGGVPGVEHRRAQVRAAADSAEGFDQLDAWFDRHAPESPDVVASHGDLHPLNLLVDGDRVTVLDWTNANLLPREFDIGFTVGLLRCAPMDVPRWLRPVVRRTMTWLADAFVRSYEGARGDGRQLDPARVAWFEALQYARCLAEVTSARRGLSHVVGANHPFETAADAMIERLATLTSITVRLPQRPVPGG